MSLTLYYHPLSSFCHKVLFALYETEIPFTLEAVNPGDPAARAEYLKLSPMGKIPALRDAARDRVLIETSIILEYLDTHYPGRVPLFPADPEQRLEVQLWDRLLDNYVHVPMQRIVADRIRPEGVRDPHGVAETRATLAMAYDMVERHLAGRTWMAGDAFSLADCAAAPPLFYGGIVQPFADTHPNLAAYFERLLERPAYRRVLKEAKPFFRYFPYRDAMPARFLDL